MKTRIEHGFSLVEMIIVMIITLVLATIVVTVYITQAREVRESMAYSQVQRGHDLFLEQFGRDVRFAEAVLLSSEEYGGDGATYGADADNVKDIKVYYRADSIITYSLGDAVLRNGEPFGIGGDDLQIEGDGSFITLNPYRKWITVTLQLVYDDGKTVVNFTPREDKFRCRN